MDSFQTLKMCFANEISWIVFKEKIKKSQSFLKNKNRRYSLGQLENTEGVVLLLCHFNKYMPKLNVR